MFPTRAKTKISSSLAYPANAKLILEALADVPQAPDLSIFFVYWRSTARIHESSLVYPVMAVEYSFDKASQYTSHQLEEAGLNQPKWQIWVQPVRSTLKHQVRGLIECGALPKIHGWLVSKKEFTGRLVSCNLTVWYDEDKDELRYGER